jgi:exopolysaccharide biosynthesis WecB/TagA/CpsF family protein
MPLRTDARRARLLDLPVDALPRSGVEETLSRFVQVGGFHQVITLNLDFLSIASRNAEFRAVVQSSDLVVADGQPVVWAARYLGMPVPERVTGPDLIEMAVRHSQENGSSLFFLGAAPGVASAAVEALTSRMGAFHVAGAYAPPYGPIDGPEDIRIRTMIATARPDFLFVAFGCPRQDLWIRQHADLEVPVSIGVGGSFDLLSGAIPRAPRWMQTCGLEWAFRLSREPRRLAKRYLVDDPPIAARLLLSKFSAGDK